VDPPYEGMIQPNHERKPRRKTVGRNPRSGFRRMRARFQHRRSPIGGLTCGGSALPGLSDLTTNGTPVGEPQGGTRAAVSAIRAQDSGIVEYPIGGFTCGGSALPGLSELTSNGNPVAKPQGGTRAAVSAACAQDSGIVEYPIGGFTCGGSALPGLSDLTTNGNPVAKP
jgi:hypothetical protein